MLRLAFLLILLPGVVLAQTKNQLPTGKQYLVGQLAAAESKIADMLDEIASLRQQIETMREMFTKREEKNQKP